MNISLEGKVALVTGGGVGIGRGIVQKFVEIGAKVVVAELRARRCDRLRNELPDVHVVECDVRDVAQVNALAEDIKAKFGRLDVLVNNVGNDCGVFKQLVHQTDEEIDAVYRTNIFHMLTVSRAMIPLLRTSGEGGSIINFSSVEGHRGYPYNIVYTTMKHAVTGLTRGLAIELAPDKIRVNTISPETTDTPGCPLDVIVRDGQREAADRTIPLGRFGTVEDQANAAVYLATDMSSWVTGTTIHVDGGALAGNVFQRTPRGEWTNMPIVTDKAAIDFQDGFK